MRGYQLQNDDQTITTPGIVLTQESGPSKTLTVAILKVQIDSGLDGTYSTTSSTFAQLAFNMFVGPLTVYDPNSTTIKCIAIAEIDAQSGTTGEIDLYNITDDAQVTGSVVGFSDLGVGVWSVIELPELTLTAGKTYRFRMRRVTGQGQSPVTIRAGALVIKTE